MFMNCVFCNMDNTKIENTIIEETDNFYVLPAVGSLVDGYVLVVSKRHVNSMSELNDLEKIEYKNIIEKYRNIFKKIYGKYPIVFEHGTPIINSKMKANSVIHARLHIVNHHYLAEQEIIKRLNLKRINDISKINDKQNYIMYISPKNICYVSYKFESISQMTRKIIARDLGMKNKYDWKKEKFISNIDSTIKKITLNKDH